MKKEEGDWRKMEKKKTGIDRVGKVGRETGGCNSETKTKIALLMTASYMFSYKHAAVRDALQGWTRKRLFFFFFCSNYTVQAMRYVKEPLAFSVALLTCATSDHFNIQVHLFLIKLAEYSFPVFCCWFFFFVCLFVYCTSALWW